MTSPAGHEVLYWPGWTNNKILSPFFVFRPWYVRTLTYRCLSGASISLAGSVWLTLRSQASTAFTSVSASRDYSIVRSSGRPATTSGVSRKLGHLLFYLCKKGFPVAIDASLEAGTWTLLVAGSFAVWRLLAPGRTCCYRRRSSWARLRVCTGFEAEAEVKGSVPVRTARWLKWFEEGMVWCSLAGHSYRRSGSHLSTLSSGAGGCSLLGVT